MNAKSITSAKEYKEEYRRKRESKHINKDPEIKKRFGVFKVSEILKYDDKKHFQNLYNYQSDILDDYMLPEEKREREKKEKALKEKEKAKLMKEKHIPVEEDNQVERQLLDNIMGLNNNNNTGKDEENIHLRRLKEELLKVFDPSRVNDEDNQEQEYYEKKDSKTGKEIAKMKNGEQVVQFFAMYGDTTPVKFIFCQKIIYNNPYRFRPYDLDIISMKQVKKLDDFYIITPSGITHVYKPKFSDENIKRDNKPNPSEMNQENKLKLGEESVKKENTKSVGEFFTLSDWMYQSTLFNILMKIKYFKDYLPFKIFTIWRNYNRFKRYLRIRGSLANKLFLSKPAYVEELIQANGQVCLMENVTLQEVSAKTWNFQNLQDFVDHQKRTLETAKMNFVSRITSEVSDVMKNLYFSLNKRLKRNIEINEIENNKTLQELRNKSMYHLKLEKIQRKKLIKRATMDRDSYDRFANMVDLMVVEMYYQLYKRELTDIYYELTRVRNDSNYSGIFTLYLNFMEGEVSLNPSEKDLLDHFRNLYKSVTEALVDVPRVKVRFSRKDLDEDEKKNSMTENQVENSETIKHNLKEVLEKSDYYKSTTEMINTRLNQEYKRAMEYSRDKMFPFKKLQVEKETTKIEDFLQQKPTIEEIGERITTNTLNTVNVESIISSYTQREFIMNIDSSTVKENFKTYLDNIKEAVEKYLIKCFKSSYHEIVGIKKVGEEIVKIKKKDIKSICETKEAISNFSGEMERLKDTSIKFKQMHELLGRCKLDAANKLSIADELNQATDLYDVYQGLERKVKDTLSEIGTMRDNSLVSEINESLKTNRIKITDLIEDLTTGNPYLFDVNTPVDQIKTELTSMEGKIKSLETVLNTNNYYKRVLEGYNDSIKDPEMSQLWEMFNARNLLWNSLISLQENWTAWNRNTIAEIRLLKIEEKITEYEKTRQNLYSVINRDDYEDKVYALYKTEVSNINNLAPILTAISQPCLQERHFKEIFELIKVPFIGMKTLEEKTLQELISRGVEGFSNQIEKIAAASIAQNEITMNMDLIEKEWSECDFGVKKHNTKDKHIINSIEKPMQCIEAHSQLIQSALNSIYVNDIRDRVQKWDDDLTLIGRVIEEWLMVQKQWIYLENIFSAEDIKKQIADAYNNFSKVNKGFIDLMQKTYDKPNVYERCKANGLLDMLMKFNKDLDNIQKSLELYLQTKRESFPRFYFLSNDELLKILSQTRNPRAVQDYLIKCFDGIKTIRFFSETSNEIVSMVSPENEEVKLNKELIAHENINAWLCDLEEIMLSTCYDEVKKCLEGHPEFSLNRRKWILDSNYICQAVITVDQIMWAHCIEKALNDMSLNPNSLKEYLLTMNSQLKELADLVLIKPYGDEDKFALGKSLLERLVIVDVHGRQVLKDLIRMDVRSKEDFEWQKNLKFYWDKENYPTGEKMDVIIRQTNSRFVFGYEYLGNPERMVITPLTDKCYITLTSAMNLNFGGAPAGPAGTGKTETTKDLGKALAVKVNVFNCTDQLDLKMMSRMFCGLAECGAWACFDEFNRIDLEVLSVIAQQVEVIQSALREKACELIFEGKPIKLKPRFGVFITMNPGYAGRSELPDNLKSLFRPVAMMIPDYALVAQVILLSKGFKEAEILSIKMHQLFKLSSEQLSNQKHYDFGLRGIKSILTRAGYLKEKYFKDPENIVLIRAMKDSNLPKFLDNDIELFEDIIKDLFPGVVVEKEESKTLTEKVQETLNSLNLIHDNPGNRLVEKINQLLDTLMVRCGNMIVGYTGVGKTTVYTALAKTLTDLGKLAEKGELDADPWFCQIIVQLLNPKSVNKSDLYMSKDEVTQSWEDGIVAKMMREAEEEEKEEAANNSANIKEGGKKKQHRRKWVVFDGPVDALWIEDMNTVLDDSRKLCLPDGSNIRIPILMNLVFEVNDLRVASPATVSRCGMVYIEPHHIGYKPLIDTWYLNYKKKMKTQFEAEGSEKAFTKEVKRFMEALDVVYNTMKEIIPKIILVLRTKCKEKIPSVDVNLVQSCINYLHCFLNTEKIPLTGNIEELMKLYMAFSMFWAFGGNVEDNDRKVISKTFFTELIAKKNIPLDTISSDIYDVVVDPKEVCFSKWSSIPHMFKYEKSQSFFNILVPTEDTIKYKYIMEQLANHSYHSLFMGETGVGKSVIAMDFLKSLNSSFIFKSSNFSAKTTSKNIFDLFKANIFKNGNFQPPAGKRFIYLIDDINLPQLDTYGSQQPIEFIRQLIDNRMFYDEKRLAKKIKDCVFMACCAPPSGGRNPVTPRLFRHFNMVWMPDLKQESMKTIFKEILKGYLDTAASTNNKAAAGLAGELDDIMEAALEVYKRIKAERLPTPSKSHYTFNLRDLSKVVQGMLQMQVEKLTDKAQFCNLWVHETCRQFRDRLLRDDIEWFDGVISGIYSGKFGLEKGNIDPNTLIFTTLLDKTQKFDYKMVEDFALLNRRVKEALEKNNNSKANYMNLVFFTDATNHFCRIARILSQQRGNALLVGLGGSGRQSLTKLVGSSLAYQYANLNIGKGYDVVAFWKDIASILVRVGTSDNLPHIFIFSDTQIIQESFLEDINNILNNGEVPNLLKDDEMNNIYNSLKDVAKDTPGYNETKDSVYQFFVSRVRDNLRIVLSFSPVGAGFRNRCRQFPSIINCCTIDWFNVWPDDALASVAEKFLSDKEDLKENEDLKSKLQIVFVKIHTKAMDLASRMERELLRYYYITPTSYLEFIKLFMVIYEEKLREIPKQISNYKLGIQKLNEANVIVKELKEELIKLEPQQIEKKAEVEGMIDHLEKSKAQVEVERSKLKGDKDIVQAKRDEIAKEKEECDNELALAMPALERAKAALLGLKEQDIKQLGSYPNPSDNLVKMGRCVCAIFDCKTFEYPEFKTLVMATKSFMENCVNEEGMIQKLSNPRKVKNVNELWAIIEVLDYSRISEAAVGLKNWIGSILMFVSKYKEVKPKIDAVEVMKKQLAEIEANLEEKSKVLYEKEAELKKLIKSFNDANNELKKLSDSIENINTKSKRATRLVEGLRAEGKRWKENIAILEVEEQKLLANVLLASSMLGYSGPYPLEYRKEFLNSVKAYIIECGIYFSEEEEQFSLTKSLVDALTVREWTYAGLPADDLSIENAIITVRSKRWPLIIDPQMQANKWIKSFFKSQGMKVYKATFKNLFNRTKDCVSSGYPVLIENVENTVDTSLEPILQKNIYMQGSTPFLAMGADKPIHFNQNFKLFLTSKLANPHYLPELSIKVTLINFTVTLKGLEDQLLVDVVKHERPDLEAQRDNLILNINENKKLIKDLETTILNMVKDAGTDILDTDHLVNKLDQSKVQSEKIKKDLEEAEMTANKINKERRAYKPIAIRGSIIYFVIASLANVDSMYNYSLEYFAKLFNQRLEKSEQNSSVPKRVEILINDLTISFYEKICRGLFVKDQTLYSFLILMNILLQEGEEVNQMEWSFFLKGATLIYKLEDTVEYLSDEQYLKFITMQECGLNFKEIKKSLKDDKDIWNAYMHCDEPLNFRLPESIEKVVTDFQRLSLVKTVREEKLIASIKDFIVKKFKDQRFVMAPPFSVSQAFEDSYKNTPLIFILSPGANPIYFLKQFAKEKNQKLMTLSLGQNQDKFATSYIKRARETGDWVCLENCHLYLSWMSSLEEIQEELHDSSLEIHPNYRLWLTSTPVRSFPASILQSGVKITNEPPKGIKANLTGTFQNIKESELLNTKKPKELKPLLFSLAFFHAVILERRKFGALGWNIPYEWMNSDFDASKLHLMKYLDEYHEIPISILNFLIGTINYGGRVTDDKDGKLISAILAKYFNHNILTEKFSFSEDGRYYIPKYDTIADLNDYLEKMPLDDGPDIFGLHANANITLQKNLVMQFMEPLISIQPRTASSLSKKPDDLVLDMKRFVEGKFAGVSELDLSKDSASIYIKDPNNPNSKKRSSLGNFLLQESEKFNNLLKIIKSTLNNLELAVKGLLVMSPDLELVYYSFLDGKVPLRWELAAYLSLKPLSSWVVDLVERFVFMRQWLDVGGIKSYWVSAFFFPQGFNTAVLQAHARVTNIPIDDLTFETKVFDIFPDALTKPETKGVVIHGLFIQGASWNVKDKKVKEPIPGELNFYMPCIHMNPVEKEKFKKDGLFECPLYKTSRRAGELSTTGSSTNFVMYFYLKTTEEVEHWIRRGAALITQLDN